MANGAGSSVHAFVTQWCFSCEKNLDGGTSLYASTTTISNSSADAKQGLLKVAQGPELPLSNMESKKRANLPPPPMAKDFEELSWKKELALDHLCTLTVGESVNTKPSPLP